MDNQRQDYLHILLFYFWKSKNEMQDRKKLCDVYDEDYLSKSQCQRWFAFLRSWNLNVHDAPHTGCSATTDNYKVTVLIETN